MEFQEVNRVPMEGRNYCIGYDVKKERIIPHPNGISPKA